jgi:hypothetical protein
LALLTAYLPALRSVLLAAHLPALLAAGEELTGLRVTGLLLGLLLHLLAELRRPPPVLRSLRATAALSVLLTLLSLLSVLLLLWVLITHSWCLRGPDLLVAR